MLHTGSKPALVCSGAEENHQELKRKHEWKLTTPWGCSPELPLDGAFHTFASLLTGGANIQQLEKKSVEEALGSTYFKADVNDDSSLCRISVVINVHPTSTLSITVPNISCPFSIPCL